MQNIRIVSYADRNFRPNSIEVTYSKDSKETFTLGDLITNDRGMRGNITDFSLSKDGDDVFVETTWSKVGVNIEQIWKVILLPSQHQVDDQAILTIEQPMVELKGIAHKDAVNKVQIKCYIRCVHFYRGKVKYDIELPLRVDGSTRMYNIDSCFIS